jgi:RimJ/RimL family protein N-acetyltransferase
MPALILTAPRRYPPGGGTCGVQSFLALGRADWPDWPDWPDWAAGLGRLETQVTAVWCRRQTVGVHGSDGLSVRRVGFRAGTDGAALCRGPRRGRVRRESHAPAARVDTEFVAQLDRAMVKAGWTRWTVLAREPAGECVGGTEVMFEPWSPRTVFQQSTGIDPAHRGLGLARWAKALMLRQIRAERPAVRRVRTGNAFSNAPMLAINEALGFQVTSTRTEWLADVAALRAAPVSAVLEN